MTTKVKIDQLRKADIIVSTTDASVSKLIRMGIGADFSHSMLYKGNSIVIEAVGEGVIERSWGKATADATLAIALRRRNMTEEKQNDVIKYAESFKGLPYDGVGAGGAGLYKKRGALMGGALVLGGFAISPIGTTAAVAFANIAILNNARNTNKDKAFFCSELVARAYQLAGMPLSDGIEPSFINPREVRMSSKLMYVGHLIS